MGSLPRIQAPGSTLAERAALVVVAAIAVLTVALHLIAVAGPTGALWGLHQYAFLPRPMLGFGLAALLVGLAVALRLPAPAARGDPDVPTPLPGRAVMRALIVPAAGGLSFALFWALRIRHRFLGDAMVLVQDIPQPGGVHALEPVAMALQRHLYSATRAWFEQPGRTAGDVAHLTTALGSAIAGVLFVFTAIEISRQLVLSVADRAPPQPVAPARDLRVALGALVLLAQGYVQLFFGYVENYTFLALAIAYYVATALAFLNGRGGLLPVVLASSVATCLHLSAAALAPSLGVLLLIGLATPELRTLVRRDLVPTIVLLGAMGLLLASMGNGYDLMAHLTATIRTIAAGDSWTGPYLFTPAHLRDMANLQLLIGPIGLAALVLLMPGLRRHSANRRVRAFLLALAGTYAVVAVIAGDSNLGYARNWDLLAPAGIPFTVAALFLLLEQIRNPVQLQRALAVAGLVSVFHTASWVALNASLERSLERFKTLPLGGGRTESTVGYWYVCQGRPDLAEPWLHLALRENPSNARARMWLGHACMMSGRPQEAAAQFRLAVDQRPDVPLFRLSLINCLVLARESAAALSQARLLVRAEPTAARGWAVLGTVLLTLGQSTEAHDAFERAVPVALGLPNAASMRSRPSSSVRKLR